MEKFLLVLVFAVGFVIKASNVLGAEAGNKIQEKPASVEVVKGAKETVAPVVVTNQESDSNLVQPQVDVKELEPKAAKSSDMRIQNNITFGQVTSPIDYKPKTASPGGEASSSQSSSAEVKNSNASTPISISPMVGATMYQGAWRNHIENSYTLGVAMEVSLIPALALEAEFAQGRYYISYSNYGHNFTQYTYGGNAKVYLTRGTVQTYVGGGILGITYQNMTYGMNSFTTYDRTVGAGQAIAGVDLPLSEKVAIGIRGSYIVPLFNRVPVESNGYMASQGFEDAAAMDTAMCRLMGALKISL